MASSFGYMGRATPAAALGVAIVVCVAATAARAHGLPDQVNTPPTLTTVSCGGDPSGPTYQSFTPTRRLLASVDLHMRAGGSFPAAGTSATIRIRNTSPGGPVVATTTRHVAGPISVGGSVVVHFDFAPPAALDPENVFVIEGPALHPTVLTWFARDDNPYAAGTMFGCNTQESPMWDLNFATFVPTDAEPPETTISRGPNEGAFTSRPAGFAFGGRDDLSYASRLRFECELDGSAFTACPAMVQFDVADGGHRLAVRAVDEAGKADPTPATRSWTVDTTPPAAPRVRGPQRSTARTVTYRFVSLDALTPARQLAFRCAVNSTRLKPCRTPYRLRLAPGRHLLRVVAIDLAGNRSRVAATKITIAG